MRRCLLILLTLIAAALPAGADQEISGVTVKRDGDSVVLIPNDPGKTILVFGCPREGTQLACVPDRITWLVGEQRFPIKELARITLVEVKKITELELGPEMKELPAPPPVDPKPCRCDKPPPPPPPSAQDPSKKDPP